MKYIFPLLFALLLLNACVTRDMRVLTARPANIFIDKTIQKVVLVNRSQSSGAGVVEGIFTGEMPGSDIRLAQECLRGLNQTLNLSDRFATTTYDKNLKSSDASSNNFGTYMEWTLVDSICDATGSDALLAIEFFDSDFIVAPVVNTGAILNPSSGQAMVSAKGTANARAGFRLYDRKQHKVLYEDYYKYSRWWNESATNYIEAVAKLLKKNDALMRISFELGADFAEQLVPLRYWEDRLMYRGFDPITKKGERLGLTSAWAEAANTWQEAYNAEPRLKKKGAIAYNMALAYEILGDLPLAKKWISASYVDAGSRKALDYSEVLDRLIRDKQKMEEQERKLNE